MGEKKILIVGAGPNCCQAHLVKSIETALMTDVELVVVSGDSLELINAPMHKPMPVFVEKELIYDEPDLIGHHFEKVDIKPWDRKHMANRKFKKK